MNLGAQVVKALGLDGHRVSAITLSFRVGEVPSASVEMFIEGAATVEVLEGHIFATLAPDSAEVRARREIAQLTATAHAAINLRYRQAVDEMTVVRATRAAAALRSDFERRYRRP